MKNTITALLAFAIVALAGFSFYQFQRQPKIAYVDTGRLLAEYQAMRDAKAEYEIQTREWQQKPGYSAAGSAAGNRQIQTYRLMG